MDDRVDVIVMGMGPGGEELAGRLAHAGLSVIGIEERLVGGECPYFACVPTKMMVRAAGLLEEARRVDGMAGAAVVTPDWSPVARRIRADATDDWDDRVAVERFERKGGRFVRGSARFAAPNQVAVGDHVFTATRAIVINTGTEPGVPPLDGIGDVPYWTNRDVVKVTELPESLIVVGTGPVGVELAQVFNRFGTQVTVLERRSRLLAREEPEACAMLDEVFRREGITVHCGVPGRRLMVKDAGIGVELEDGSMFTAQHLLLATGRRTNLSTLQLGRAGLDESAPFIAVDDRLRTRVAGIYAIGDITGHGAFTHMSHYQAEIAAAHILGQSGPAADYRAVPRVTFTDPEVGAVGMTEEEARAAGINVRTGVGHVPTTARGWIHKVGNDGVIKLVEDADRGILVGATSAGPCGVEVLSMLALAVHAEVPVNTLRTMIKAYPTFHRGVDDALAELPM